MVTYRIDDMTCGHCASTIARAVAGVEKDARIDVSVADKLVRISGTAPDAEFAEAIREAGYTPQEVQESAAPARAAAGGCCCAGRRTAA